MQLRNKQFLKGLFSLTTCDILLKVILKTFINNHHIISYFFISINILNIQKKI